MYHTVAATAITVTVIITITIIIIVTTIAITVAAIKQYPAPPSRTVHQVDASAMVS